MGGCSCSCKGPVKPANPEANKTYVCNQCHSSRSVKAGEPAPDCCGQQMNEQH